MAPCTYSPADFDTYIGNDVDKKSYCLAIRDRNKVTMTKTIPADPENLYNFIRHNFSDSRVVVGYEAGPTGFGLYDYMTGRNQSCVVIPTSSIPHAASERVKTNKIDATKLSSMLKEGDFSPVRVPDEPYRDLRNLVRLRFNYVRGQRVAKQRIKSLLLYNSLHTACPEIEEGWSGRSIERLKTLECSQTVRLRLDMLVEDLAYNRAHLLKVDRHMRIFCKNTPEIKEYVRCLCSIPGIGIITASATLGRIGNPLNLKGLQEIGAFVGVVPTEHSTGDSTHRGSITRIGDSDLRSMLIEAAWISIRHDKELAQFYNRIKNRHHPAIGSRKAIVAVARKLTLRIYRVLKERREYVVR
jgi:transposase